MKKIRRYSGLVLSGVLTAGSVFGGAATAFSKPVYTFAGEQLGATDFDDGRGLPWHIMESETGKMEFEIADGVYRITIVNPGGASNGGDDRWDCQFRHRGLKIVAGHTYHVHYEIKASNPGKYYTKIGNLAGDVEVWHNMSNGSDLGATWDPIPYDTAGQWKTVDLTFTAGQSLDVAEWAFHLGGDGQYTNGVCFPAGTVIEFDNMSLFDETSNENDYVEEPAWVRSDILTNQVGYFEDMAKKATLLSDSKSAVGFSLVDESGKEVWSGKSEPMGLDADSGDNVHVLDFSDFNEKGVYTIKADNGAVSREFAIGDSQTYSALLYDSLNYFYQNRSAIAIESQFITSGDKNGLARAAGHPSDVAEIRTSFTDQATSGSQDVTGGWYDAGDHGKYVVNGGISLWLLQNQYETALKTGNESSYADGTMNIPENNNGCPDLLDEARWEMDWFGTMLVKEGDCKDMVYHKVHDEKWTGLALAPADDTMKRVILPPTTAATLNVAACAAQASRLWAGIDDAYSEQCLDIAKRTYAAAKAHPDMYAPTGNFPGGGSYGDDDVTDEFYWAATELYITTGDDTYYNDMKASPFFMQVQTTLSGGESVDTYGSFDWGHTASLGTLSVLLNEDKVDAGDVSKAKDAVLAAADRFIEKENEQGYGLPYSGGTLSNTDSAQGYLWGSNSFVADNAIVIAYAYILSNDAKYLNGAVSAMDYLLGRNANDYSYVTGYGTHAAKYPHHRYWAGLIDDSFPLAPNGVMVGGPNSGMEDPWVKGMGWKKGTIPPAKCYLDHIEAYSANECTINWNAPLAWLTGFITENSKDGIIQGAVNLSAASDPGSVAPVNTAAGSADANATGAGGTGMAADGTINGKKPMSGWLIALIVFGVVAVIVSIEIFVYKMLQMKKQDAAAAQGIKLDYGNMNSDVAHTLEMEKEAVAADTEVATEPPVQATDSVEASAPTTEGAQTPVSEAAVPYAAPATEAAAPEITPAAAADKPASVIEFYDPEAAKTNEYSASVASDSPAVSPTAPEYLYDAWGNPQMRVLYDASGKPVYVPIS